MPTLIEAIKIGGHVVTLDPPIRLEQGDRVVTTQGPSGSPQELVIDLWPCSVCGCPIPHPHRLCKDCENLKEYGLLP